MKAAGNRGKPKSAGGRSSDMRAAGVDFNPGPDAEERLRPTVGRSRPIHRYGLNPTRSMRMSARLMRRQEVEKLTGLSRASIYRLIRSGRFPPPVRVSDAAVRVEGERDQRLDRVPAGGDE